MIQLQDIEFSPCSVIWDNEKKEFRKNTVDEIYKCCDKKCTNYRENCNQFCNKNHKNVYDSAKTTYPEGTKFNTLDDCLFSCNVMGNICDKMCQSARFDWEQKYFDSCLDKSGCLKNEYLDNQCLIDNKNNLLSCCMKNCKPTLELDCKQHCAISYDINLERSTQNKLEKNRVKQKNSDKYNGDNSNLLLYLIISSIFLISLFFIAFKLKWLIMKN